MVEHTLKPECETEKIIIEGKNIAKRGLLASERRGRGRNTTKSENGERLVLVAELVLADQSTEFKLSKVLPIARGNSLETIASDVLLHDLC